MHSRLTISNLSSPIFFPLIRYPLPQLHLCARILYPPVFSHNTNTHIYVFPSALALSWSAIINKTFVDNQPHCPVDSEFLCFLLSIHTISSLEQDGSYCIDLQSGGLIVLDLCRLCFLVSSIFSICYIITYYMVRYTCRYPFTQYYVYGFILFTYPMWYTYPIKIIALASFSSTVCIV